MKREPLRFVNVMERSPLQYISKTFTRSSKVTLPNIMKGLVKVTFPSHLQYLNGFISKSLRSLKVYFRSVESAADSRGDLCADFMYYTKLTPVKDGCSKEIVFSGNTQKYAKHNFYTSLMSV